MTKHLPNWRCIATTQPEVCRWRCRTPKSPRWDSIRCNKKWRYFHIKVKLTQKAFQNTSFCSPNRRLTFWWHHLWPRQAPSDIVGQRTFEGRLQSPAKQNFSNTSCRVIQMKTEPLRMFKSSNLSRTESKIKQRPEKYIQNFFCRLTLSTISHRAKFSDPSSLD